MYQKIDPSKITESHYKRIWERLQSLVYPCVVVVYGAERTHVTTYRGEHQSEFGISRCENAHEAWNVVDCGWHGWPPDLCIYSIPVGAEVDISEVKTN